MLLGAKATKAATAPARAVAPFDALLMLSSLTMPLVMMIHASCIGAKRVHHGLAPVTICNGHSSSPGDRKRPRGAVRPPSEPQLVRFMSLSLSFALAPCRRGAAHSRNSPAAFGGNAGKLDVLVARSSW